LWIELTDEIPELLQLVLPQLEVCIPRYKIMKVTMSAKFCGFWYSNVSSIAPGICMDRAEFFIEIHL
jgi:hypothetical protein